MRDKRGYLLPHHGLLALSAPNLLQHYDQLYSSLTLTDRYLDRHDHEFVWLGVLMSTQEALGTHHVQRFLNAGGTVDEVGSAAPMAVAIIFLSRITGRPTCQTSMLNTSTSRCSTR